MKLPAKAKPGNKLIFNKVKIGILGGTFDPAHKGHLEISKKAKKQIGLKKRISLAKKLTISHKFIKVKYYENKINSSKTINLINYLKKDKKIEIFFIMGADNLINFHKWHRWKSISQKCNILVFDRHGYKAKSLKSITFRQLSKKRLTFVKFKKVNISSSQLRKI